MKSASLICPRCGNRHECPKIWFMYVTSGWIGYVCMFYCTDGSASTPIFKLYGEDFRYVAWQTDLQSGMSWFESDGIPF